MHRKKYLISLEHACCREGGGVKRLRGRVNECIGRSI